MIVYKIFKKHNDKNPIYSPIIILQYIEYINFQSEIDRDLEFLLDDIF